MAASVNLRVFTMRKPHEELPDLSLSEAVDLLKIHSGSCEDCDDQRLTSGLIFSLRAWNDKPNPDNFQDVMSCIKALGPTWASERVPTRPISDLWSILYLGNSYVQDPRRQQQREEYILEPEEFDLEQRWLDCIGYAVMIFLQFDDADEAFSLYDDFVTEQSADNS